MIQCVGKIDKNGAIKIGKNFNCTKVKKGVFTVTFNDNLFISEPVVVATVDITDTKSDTYTACISLHNTTKDGFTVTIQSMNGDLMNFDFDFIASSI